MTDRTAAIEGFDTSERTDPGGPDDLESDPAEVGERITELLAHLSAHGDPAVGEAAEDLARLLMGMYGAGLRRIIGLATAVPGGERCVAAMASDELVAALLVLHDLHPEDTASRVERALARVRPYLGSHAGDVEFLGLVHEPAGPVARLALTGGCDGCPSSAVTVSTAIEKTIEELCPEVVRVDVRGLATPAPNGGEHNGRELPLLQIGLHPPGAQPRHPGPDPAEPSREPAWTVLDPPPLRPGQCAQLTVAGTAVLLALPAGAHSPGTGLVAYLDRCPACLRCLDDAVLRRDELSCAGCGASYDVRRAGRAVPDRAGSPHLEPLPLVERAGRWRIAVPRQPVLS